MKIIEKNEKGWCQGAKSFDETAYVLNFIGATHPILERLKPSDKIYFFDKLICNWEET